MNNQPLSLIFFDVKIGESLSNITAPEAKGHFLCSTQINYITPGWVRTANGEWLVVIQSKQWDISQVKFTKYVNIEINH